MSDGLDVKARSFLESVKMYPEVHTAAADIMDEIGGSGEAAIREKYGNFIVDLAMKLVGNPATDRQAATFMDAIAKINGVSLPTKYAELLEAAPPKKSAADASGGKKFPSKGGMPKPPPDSKKVQVSGDVASTKWEERSYMGKTNRTAKMLLLCRDVDGSEYKVWSTVPKPLRDKGDIANLKGDRVTLEVELIPSKEDSKFKIAKWPVLVAHNPSGGTA